MMLRLLLMLFCLGLSLPLPAAVRIISLAPHITELAYAAGLDDQLIAASHYSDYPPQAAELERVASWQSINLERILALKPDLILAWPGGHPQRQLDQLSQFGVRIIYLKIEKITDIATSLELLANYSNKPHQAKSTAAQFRQQLNRLQQQYQTKNQKRVLLQFSTYPLFTSSKNTLQSQILNLCGAENIFADSPIAWPQISREEVLIRKPQAIVIPGSTDDIQTIKTFWGKQLDVPIIAIPDSWLSRNSPRIILAAQRLCYELKVLGAQHNTEKQQ